MIIGTCASLKESREREKTGECGYRVPFRATLYSVVTEFEGGQPLPVEVHFAGINTRTYSPNRHTHAPPPPPRTVTHTHTHTHMLKEERIYFTLLSCRSAERGNLPLTP